MRSALLACAVVICCYAVLAWQPARAAADGGKIDRTERKVIRLVNRIRAHHGLRRLKTSRRLARAASQHTGDMLARNFLSHASSDGTGMAQRLRHYTRANWIGENIAVLSGGSTASRAVRLWMQSPPHRAVLLSPAGGRIGVGKRRGRLGNASRAVYTADLASLHR